MSKKLKILAALNVVGWAVVAPLLVSSLVRPLLGFSDWPGSSVPARPAGTAPLAKLDTPAKKPASDRDRAKTQLAPGVRIVTGPDGNPIRVIGTQGGIGSNGRHGPAPSRPRTPSAAGVYRPGGDVTTTGSPVSSGPNPPVVVLPPPSGTDSSVATAPELPAPQADGDASPVTQAPPTSPTRPIRPVVEDPTVPTPEVPQPAPSASPSPAPTETATPVPTETATPAPTETATPVPTETATPAPTETATPVPTATATPTPADTTPAPGDDDHQPAHHHPAAAPIADRPPKVKVTPPGDDGDHGGGGGPVPVPPPTTPPAPTPTKVPKPPTTQTAPATAANQLPPA